MRRILIEDFVFTLCCNLFFTPWLLSVCPLSSVFMNNIFSCLSFFLYYIRSLTIFCISFSTFLVFT